MDEWCEGVDKLGRFDRLYMGNDGVMGMDWERIGKGLIYMAKWVFLKLLGKLRGL